MLRQDQIEHIQAELDPSVCIGLCVNPSTDGNGTDVKVWLHNEFIGHNFPSGAAQDRRVWVELHAFDGATEVLQSGVVADDASIDAAAEADAMLWVLRDFAYKDEATRDPAKMFWEIGYIESDTLAVAANNALIYDRTTWKSRTWSVEGPVDRATIRVKVRPIPFELVDELVDDGLDPAVKDRIPTFTLAETVREWTPEAAEMTDFEGPCIESAVCFCNLANELEKC